MATLRALRDDMTDQELLGTVVLFYHERLKECATAQAFLRGRGLAQPDLIDRFQLGFADRKLGLALPDKQLKAGRLLRERLTQLGILRRTGHGHFNGCVVVPVRDADGRIIDIVGRKISKSLRKGTPLDMRLPGAPENVPIVDETLVQIVYRLQGKDLVGEWRSSVTAAPPQETIPTPPEKNSPHTAASSKSKPLEIEQTDTEIIIYLDDRRWRIRGLQQNLSYERLKVNVLVSRHEGLHVDTFDLYSSRHRAGFINAAAAELYVEEDTLKKDLGRILRKLEELQDQHLKTMLTPQEPQSPSLTEKERSDALALLKNKKLLDRILDDFNRCGLVGERTNKQLCYLACVSRRLQQPLAVLIQSSSAAGKTTLMDVVLSLMPPEEQVKYSAMTGQSLYYMGKSSLKHKILAIAEEEGVVQASYALKLLQSESRLTIASAEKESSGRQRTQTYEVEGPVMMLLTTTQEHPDPELQNRCLTLRVNEKTHQTEAIHALQRAGYTSEGRQAARQRMAIQTLHQNAQRLLEPMTVDIPWASELTFRADQTRMRRDHAKYLSLIAAITLLHQYQRVVKTDDDGAPCVVATLEDIETANRLAGEALGQSLDSLMPQTRRLLELIDDFVSRSCREQQPPGRCDFRFTQRQLREVLGWSDFQVRKHLARLVELEYVLVHRTARRNQRHYELMYDGQGRSGERFLLGLIDVAKLRTWEYDNQNEQLKPQNEPRASPNRAVNEPPSSPPNNGATSDHSIRLRQNGANCTENGQEGLKESKSRSRS